MKTSSKSSYLRFVLTMLFLLQAVPSDTAKAVTSRAMGIGQQIGQAQTTIAQAPPDAALPPSTRQLYLPLLANGSRTAVITPDTLATPRLIQQAFARGEITEAEQALYLAYALYEPQSLPAQFHSNVGWYGTQYVQEVQDFLQQVNVSSTDAVHQELSRMSTLAATVCDTEDGANSTNSANFHFNYATILGGLAIGDYIASMETTFTIEVTQFGWAKPPLNGNNPFGKYPIQIFALGGGLYGYVSGGGGGLYTGFIGDNPNTPAVETDALSSCMVLNNNFDQFPEPTAQASLDATTSHEFVHAIQNGYGDPGTREDRMWYESGAAYMEDEIFDDANSDYSYLWPEVENCLGEWPNDGPPGGISQYSNFLFFRHVAEHHGGTNVADGGENVMQHFWENVGAGQEGLGAYNNALVTAGTNLPDAFHQYAIAAQFEKGCSGGYAGAYCFEEGPDYTAFMGGNLPPVHDTIAANPGTYMGSIKNNYAVNWVSLPTTGSPYKVTLTNTASGGSLRGSVVCDTGTALAITPFAAVVGAGSATVINAFDASGCTRVVAVLTNQEQTADNPASCTVDSYTLALSAPQAATPTPTVTNTPTNTPVVPTATATNTPTNTPVVPTATATNTPTNTPVVPTATATNTPVAPTATATNTPTNTPVAPTATATNSQLDQGDFKTISSTTTAPDATYPAQSPQGVVVLSLKTENEGRSLRNVSFHLSKLTRDNYLLNADGGPGKEGSKLSVPDSALPGGNQLWDENEKLTQDFRIGLQSNKSFSFKVDVYAIKIKTVAAGADAGDDGEIEELIGSFLIDVDPEAPIMPGFTLYLPVVRR